MSPTMKYFSCVFVLCSLCGIQVLASSIRRQDAMENVDELDVFKNTDVRGRHRRQTGTAPEEAFDMRTFVHVMRRQVIDFVVIMDRSWGMGKRDFYLQQKKLVRSIINQCTVLHPNFAHLAIVTFALSPEVVLDNITPGKGTAITKAELFTGYDAPWEKVLYRIDPEISKVKFISRALCLFRFCSLAAFERPQRKLSPPNVCGNCNLWDSINFPEWDHSFLWISAKHLLQGEGSECHTQNDISGKRRFQLCSSLQANGGQNTENFTWQNDMHVSAFKPTSPGRICFHLHGPVVTKLHVHDHQLRMLFPYVLWRLHFVCVKLIAQQKILFQGTVLHQAMAEGRKILEAGKTLNRNATQVMLIITDGDYQVCQFGFQLLSLSILPVHKTSPFFLEDFDNSNHCLSPKHFLFVYIYGISNSFLNCCVTNGPRM